ncbi:hypothetical protein ACTRHI_002635 [Enterococcus faecium]|uniref:hypothetical protein n=1 Tax=Enterococcus faecium TaxID=1352 RepID=UPI001D17A57E|nr:hypothetical protein [Enterococcus faecium]MCC4054121.1 hypothetical protein [Enterococcus faecium]
MNKYYWNEYQSQFVDKEFEKKILKMYQFSLPKEEMKLENYKELVDFSRLNIPDIVMESYSVYSIESKELLNMFEDLKSFVKKNQMILCFPVIYINNFIGELKIGSYMFDVYNDRILQISNQEITDNSWKSDIIVSWFLDLEKSLIIYGKSSLFNGIKHTMNIRELTYKRVSIQSISLFRNHQRFVKDIGINPKLALLIEADSVIGGS